MDKALEHSFMEETNRYYHILVDTPTGDDKRGKASNIDELFQLLTLKEKQAIFTKDAFKALQNIFKKEVRQSEDSYMGYAGGLPIQFISNGYEITTLVFYF